MAHLVSLTSLIGIWIIAAIGVGDTTILPGPWMVLGLIGQELANGELFTHVGATLLRVIAAFTLALSLGSLFGILLGRSEKLNAYGDSWLITFLNLPALVVIVLCYLWIGLNEVAAVLAVAINKIPMIASMMREGARAMDHQLSAMARLYNMPRSAQLRHVMIPQLAPHFASAARAGISLTWKIVLVVEFLGRPDGVGFQIHLYFQLFDVGMVMAYAVSFIAVMMAVEHLILQPAERRARAWRVAA